MALLSHHLPHDSVGIACQHCPINNETAMRFLVDLLTKPIHKASANNETVMRFMGCGDLFSSH